VAGRSCGLFTVLGMAGVGKPRLAAEFVRGAGATVLTGVCLPYGQGITNWPVVSIIRQLLDPGHGSAGAAQLMARDPKVAAAIDVLVGEQADATSPAEIAWAVRKLVESCASRSSPPRPLRSSMSSCPPAATSLRSCGNGCRRPPEATRYSWRRCSPCWPSRAGASWPSRRPPPRCWRGADDRANDQTAAQNGYRTSSATQCNYGA